MTPNDVAILDFEAVHAAAGSSRSVKVRAIRETFGITESIYIRRLYQAVDQVDALSYRPMLVARIRRQRDHLRAVRTGQKEDADAHVQG